MKKALLILLSVILCLSMLTGCSTTSVDKILDDVSDAVPNADNQGTDPDDTPVNPADKQTAIDSFNKLDLSAFAGTSIDYMSIIKNVALSAGFEVSGTIDGDEGSIDLDAAIKNGVIYLKSAMSFEGEDEIFVNINDDTLDMYHRDNANVGDEMSEWDKNSISISDMMNSSTDAITDVIAKITIPKLEDKYLTEKNDMLLVSNDYIIDLIKANTSLIVEITDKVADREITEDEISEGINDIKEALTNYEFELYIGTGRDTINKLAVSLNVDEIEIYGELALTVDAKALDYINVKVKCDYSEDEFVYAPEYFVTLKTILGDDNALVGCKLDANITAVSYSNGTSEDTDDDNIGTYTTYRTYEEIAINAEINLANIGNTDASIVTVNVKSNDVKASERVYERNHTTGEEIISCKEVALTDNNETKFTATLKSVSENKITLDAALKSDSISVNAEGALEYTVKDDKFDFNGSFKTTGFDLKFSGFVDAGDFTMPALPTVK